MFYRSCPFRCLYISFKHQGIPTPLLPYPLLSISYYKENLHYFYKVLTDTTVNVLTHLYFLVTQHVKFTHLIYHTLNKGLFRPFLSSLPSLLSFLSLSFLASFLVSFLDSVLGCSGKGSTHWIFVH